MAKEILMPRQGNTVESCILLEWRKQEGDAVKAGDILCEVETDKATFEVESEEDGTLLKILHQEEEDVPVLEPIAVIGVPGEDLSQWEGSGAEPPAQAEEAPAAGEEKAKPAASQSSQPQMTDGSGSDDGVLAISPRARNLATAKGLDYSQLQGTGPGGRIIERDVQQALGTGEPLTPAAIAEQVASGKTAPRSGTGIGGRVTAEDVRTHEPAPEPSRRAAEQPFPGPVESRPVKGVRKLIAERMHQSLQSTAQLTLDASADARGVLAYRKKLKQSPEEQGLQRITLNDMVLYAVSRVLTEFPAMNAHFLGDEIREFAHVHLGFAVDTPRGLMVPVIRYADQLSLKEISGETRRLSEACLEGNVNPDELQGGTFTVTNLGALGIESFTPVLNPPQVGILGVNAIQPKPILQGEDVEFIPHMGFSLTMDHQGVDGAPAARFLKAVCDRVADFELLLAG